MSRSWDENSALGKLAHRVDELETMVATLERMVQELAGHHHTYKGPGGPFTAFGMEPTERTSKPQPKDYLDD